MDEMCTGNLAKTITGTGGIVPDIDTRKNTHNDDDLSVSIYGPSHKGSMNVSGHPMTADGSNADRGPLTSSGDPEKSNSSAATHDEENKASEIPNGYSWKRNENKRKRNAGEEYKTITGRTIPARVMKPVGCRCLHKCSAKFAEEVRVDLFTRYWELCDLQRQRDFIVSHTQKKQKARALGKSDRRQLTFYYHLPLNGEKVKVCRKFFLNTLGETERKVKTAVSKERHGVASPDRRGRHRARQLLDEDEKERIHAHIGSYLSREDSKGMADPDWSVRRLYRHYADECKDSQQKAASFSNYCAIFSNSCESDSLLSNSGGKCERPSEREEPEEQRKETRKDAESAMGTEKETDLHSFVWDVYTT